MCYTYVEYIIRKVHYTHNVSLNAIRNCQKRIMKNCICSWHKTLFHVDSNSIYCLEVACKIAGYPRRRVVTSTVSHDFR